MVDRHVRSPDLHGGVPPVAPSYAANEPSKREGEQKKASESLLRYNVGGCFGIVPCPPALQRKMAMRRLHRGLLALSCQPGADQELLRLGVRLGVPDAWHRQEARPLSFECRQQVSQMMRKGRESEEKTQQG